MGTENRYWRRRDLRDLALERHGVVTIDELRDHDFRSSSVAYWRRTGRVVRLAPGAYLLPDLLDDRSHLAAACVAVAGAVASHRSAAALHGFDGADPDVIELTVDRPVRARLGRVHRTSDLAE